MLHRPERYHLHHRGLSCWKLKRWKLLDHRKLEVVGRSNAGYTLNRWKQFIAWTLEVVGRCKLLDAVTLEVIHWNGGSYWTLEAVIPWNTGSCYTRKCWIFFSIVMMEVVERWNDGSCWTLECGKLYTGTLEAVEHWKLLDAWTLEVYTGMVKVIGRWKLLYPGTLEVVIHWNYVSFDGSCWTLEVIICNAWSCWYLELSKLLNAGSYLLKHGMFLYNWMLEVVGRWNAGSC